jgi:O-antigen/teichoic acid export membrane protein
MSTASRLISGSAASWAQIAVTMASQMALVPIYLSHWSVVTYGTWLAVQALVSVISTFDYGHQEFLGYEFLRIGTDNREELSSYIWSGASIGLLISLLQVFFIMGLIASNKLPSMLGKADMISPSLAHDAGIVLLCHGIAWFLSISVTGLIFRALAPFGYYPRMVWWNLGGAIIGAVAPVITVIMGANLLIAGLVSAGGTVLYSILIYADLFRLLRREQIPFSMPSIKLGLHNLVRSLALSGKWLLENARQQGVRLVLAPLAGAAGLTAFSTMRTGANVALQGLNTVVNPLMPELMRFIHQRDQERIESAFGTVWFVLVAVLAPAMVIVQAFVEPLYLLWTRGRVLFNPLLFATLSLSVLVYAVAQPAIAVVKGNNMLKPQLLLSALAAILVVGGIYSLVSKIGILSGGLALLAAEVAATIGYQIVAARWLSQNGLKWPKYHYSIANTSVIIAALSLGTLVMLPSAKWLILAVSLVLLVGNFWRYWQALPKIATEHAIRIVGNIPGLKRVHLLSKLQ